MGKAKKERYAIRNLLAQFLTHGQGSEFKERALREIITCVNEGTIHERAGRIDELATAVAKRSMKNQFFGKEEHRVLREVAQQLFQNEELEVFLRLYVKVFEKADFNFLAAALILQMWGTTAFVRDFETTGRFFFLGMVFEVAGSSLERAIQFGLFLLEQQRVTFQKVVDSWDEIRARRLDAIPRMDDYLRAVIESGAKQTADKLVEGLNREMSNLMSEHQRISGVILDASLRSAPGGLTNNSRKWVDQLINALDQNQLAEQVLESVIAVLNLNHPTQPRQYRCEFHQIKAGMEVEFGMRQAWSAVVKAGDKRLALAAFLEPIRCYVTADQLPSINRWQSRVQQRRELEVNRGNQALEWLERQRPWLEQELERKRALIRSQPRRGLRSNGADHIDIEVAPLFNAGIRAVVFYPEGRDFPNARIELLQRRETPHLISFSAELVDFEVLRLTDLIADEQKDSGRPTVAQFKFLLEVVIVDLLYTIVVERKEPRQRKATEHEQGQPAGPRPIRPHYRRLLPHQHASKAAAERARQTYGKPAEWQLPAGATFVKARYREGLLEYNYPTGPIGVYADKDLYGIGRAA